MRDSRFYTCDYCHKEFEPKRRRVQKYCSDTCRSKAYHARQSTNKSVIKKNLTVPHVPSNSSPQSNEKMSLGGIGNAATGTLLADGIKAVMTSDNNKPATRGDIKLLLEKLKGQYFLINNMYPISDGRYPYYDIDSGNVVYINPKNEG